MSVQAPPAPIQTPQEAPGAASGQRRLSRAVAALRYTPGQLRGILAILVVLILGAGATALTSVLGKSAVIEETTTQSGRLSVAALDLYQALSQADSAAASSYLTAGASSEEVRETYREALRDATVALSTAAGEVKTPEDAELVARMNTHMPVYTGLVESARTFNRLGEPVGATYQRQASTLMRNEMLPDANALQHNAIDQLNEARDSAESFPWLTTVLTAMALGVLVWAQLWMTRKTNRVFNLGTVGATVALIGVAGWLVLVALASASHTARSHEEGADPLELLAEAHIAAQQARAEESLVLIARGEDGSAEERYAEQIALLTGDDGLLAQLNAAYGEDPELAEALAAAQESAGRWNAGHDEVIKLAQEGEYTEAVALAVGEDEQSLATSFDELDEQLTEATDISAERFVAATGDARRALSGAAVGLSALCLVALVSAAIGIQMRVAEYHA
nr:MCP four helix bundle domain-containing protein [Glycomyces sp. L485]